MSIVGVKRPREDGEEFSHNKKFKADPGLSVLQLPELVENILKFNLHHTKLILTLSSLSKMHYDMIRSTAMWIRLGFSPKISTKDQLDKDTLKFILGQIRLSHANKKLQRLQKQIKSIKSICSMLTPEDPEVDLEPVEKAKFMSNNYLTDQAAIALLRIIERTMCRLFSLADLVEWLERDLQPTTDNVDWTSQIAKLKFPNYGSLTVSVKHYNNYTASQNGLQGILVATTDPKSLTEYWGFVKRLPLKTSCKKTLLFIYSSIHKWPNTNNHFSFIKFDRSTNTIECCGDFNLYAAKNFDKDLAHTMKHLAEDDELPEETLDFVEIFKSSPDDDEVEQNYAKYVAENILFVRSP